MGLYLILPQDKAKICRIIVTMPIGCNGLSTGALNTKSSCFSGMPNIVSIPSCHSLCSVNVREDEGDNAMVCYSIVPYHRWDYRFEFNAIGGLSYL